jgi:hypothetical protein
MKLAAALLAAACVGAPIAALAHPKLNPEDEAAQVKPGVTTYQDVLSALGKPTSQSFDSLGNRTIAYTTMRTHIKAATFIPYVGLLAGGMRGDTTLVVFSFGPDGRLVAYQATDSQSNCSSNIFGPGCRGGVPVPTTMPVTATSTAAAVAPQPPASRPVPTTSEARAQAAASPPAPSAPQASAPVSDPPEAQKCGVVQMDDGVKIVPCRPARSALR